MKTFNLTSYENGKIIKTVTAINMQAAKSDLEQKGYDCQDDNFLETIEQRNIENSKEKRTNYLCEEI